MGAVVRLIHFELLHKRRQLVYVFLAYAALIMLNCFMLYKLPFEGSFAELLSFQLLGAPSLESGLRDHLVEFLIFAEHFLFLCIACSISLEGAKSGIQEGMILRMPGRLHWYVSCIVLTTMAACCCFTIFIASSLLAAVISSGDLSLTISDSFLSEYKLAAEAGFSFSLTQFLMFMGSELLCFIVFSQLYLIVALLSSNIYGAVCMLGASLLSVLIYIPYLPISYNSALRLPYTGFSGYEGHGFAFMYPICSLFAAVVLITCLGLLLIKSMDIQAKRENV